MLAHPDMQFPVRRSLQHIENTQSAKILDMRKLFELPRSG